MHSTKQISPEQVYDLFPYQEAAGGSAFYCMVFEWDGAHPYLRTGDTYEHIDEHEFAAILSKKYPGCLGYYDIPNSAREIKFTLKVEPYALVDQVIVDSRTGQQYREIMWGWCRAMCSETVFIPISSDQVKKLRKKR